jgi:hypothetical protein
MEDVNNNVVIHPQPAGVMVERAIIAHIPAPFWRTHSTGVLFMLLNRMMVRGERVLASQDIADIRQATPPLGLNIDPIPAMLLSIQAMAHTPGVYDVLRMWSHRMGVMVDNDTGVPHRADALLPYPSVEDFGLWSIAVRIILLFMRQHLPVSEMDFLFSLHEIYRDAGVHAWAVEVVVHTIYFVLYASWGWKLLFCM